LREELLDVLPAELGAFHHGVTDAREHLLEAGTDLTLTDLLGASLDPLGRLVHLGLVSCGRGSAGESHGREESKRHPCPETCSCHHAPPSEHPGSHLRLHFTCRWGATTVGTACRKEERREFQSSLHTARATHRGKQPLRSRMTRSPSSHDRHLTSLFDEVGDTLSRR